jgi:transcription antitermination factor NusA-like protein
MTDEDRDRIVQDVMALVAEFQEARNASVFVTDAHRRVARKLLAMEPKQMAIRLVILAAHARDHGYASTLTSAIDEEIG